MYVTLPVEIVKPYVEKTIARLEEQIKEELNRVHELHYDKAKEREKRRENYNKLSPLQRLFKDNPDREEEKIPGMFLEHDLLQGMHQQVVERKLDTLRGLLSTLSYVDVVTLSDEDIYFYEIQLEAPAVNCVSTKEATKTKKGLGL